MHGVIHRVMDDKTCTNNTYNRLKGNLRFFAKILYHESASFLAPSGSHFFVIDCLVLHRICSLFLILLVGFKTSGRARTTSEKQRFQVWANAITAIKFLLELEFAGNVAVCLSNIYLMSNHASFLLLVFLLCKQWLSVCDSIGDSSFLLDLLLTYIMA